MNPRLVRVFIISTFRDFIQERDELVKKVFPELRRRCKERFVELLEVGWRARTFMFRSGFAVPSARMDKPTRNH
jgi:hypothetical protein